MKAKDVEQRVWDEAVRIAIQRLNRNRQDSEGAHAEADRALLAFVRKVAPEVARAHTLCYVATQPWWFA